MPVATFRCDVCGEMKSVELTRHTRRADHQDTTRPHPRHHKQPMRLVQLDYEGRRA